MTLALRREPHSAIRLGAILPAGDARIRTAPNGAEYDHRFIASTELLASDRGVIYVDAWDWKRYMKRPRWIAMHDLGAWSGKITEVSLGRGVYVNVETGLDPGRVGESGKALIVYTRYASTPFAQEVKRLYDEGGLDDVSVRWDWRTEEVRNPYEEEAQKYGEELAWVCTHAELVELSAVLLGADSGAQVIRSEVVEAFERCRSQKIALPLIERMIHGRKPLMVAVHREESVDLNAAADAIAMAKEAVATIQDLHGKADAPRQELADALVAVGNLAAVDAGPVVEGEDEPSDVALALTTMNEALAQLDLARREYVGPAITAVSDALVQLADALGLGDLVTTDRKGQPLTLDVEAILADGRPADSPVLDRLWKAFQALDAGMVG